MSAQPTIKTSFASGEWAPKLRSRVDVQKYHAGAALLRNFFVDYSGGGASTRQGTMFVNQCLSAGARLVGFQPSTTISYVLEFGQNYIRFYSNGAPILEVATTISGATNANPGVITDNAHGYNNNDWVFISGVGGMTQLNGNYYIVQNVTTTPSPSPISSATRSTLLSSAPTPLVAPLSGFIPSPPPTSPATSFPISKPATRESNSSKT